MNIKVFANTLEDSAIEQLRALIGHPAFADSNIRIMPDAHAGAGCVIGFTADLHGKVVPNIVGVDISCGMRVVKLGHMDIDLQALDSFIRSSVPSGFDVHAEPKAHFDLARLRCISKLYNTERLLRSIGTLGGGNHFIEVDRDDDGCLYLVIHTGSRNLGQQVASIYQKEAVRYCHGNRIYEEVERLKSLGRTSEIEQRIREIREKWPGSKMPDSLCYLEGSGFDDYMHDMRICGEFAELNRATISSMIKGFLGVSGCEEWECLHNYIDDQGVVRKGAIAAHKGQRVIIPLNMRDGSIIGVGKGNPEWNESGPHGAGRAMSRSEARKRVSMDEYESSMRGIYTTSVCEETLDESPMAYKDSNEIISAIAGTVEITSIIKPIYNFKAPEQEKPWARDKAKGTQR